MNYEEPIMELMILGANSIIHTSDEPSEGEWGDNDETEFG